MRKIWDKLLKTSLALLLVFSSLVLISPVTAKEVEYEIYPTPHEMKYLAKDYIIRPNVNVVFEEKIDEVTRKRMDEVLAIKNKDVTKSDAKVAGKTNILVGTYGSNGYVDKYVKENYNVDASLFEHYGSYFLASNNNEIVILGRDSDAAFYGITSLKHIFNQMDGSTIRNFEMRDYADVNIRGFIEGYYGIPWSNEDRMSLMKFGGDFKMTSYIFAPKDDPYHKNKWREEYPAEELEKIKEMVKVGNESKCRFVWTAHPFMGGFDRENADQEIRALLAKFDQLYNAGVRQFGVLGDDVGNLPREIVIRMMNEVSKWAKAKGDVYDTVFCPAGYNHSWQGNYSELNEYDAGFPADVQIFWTGEAVCQPIEQRTLEHFRRHNLPQGKENRRAPLFWLNWPVNDINHGRMLMGKGVQLKTDINIEDLNGAVTNPMQESEASKVAIFAVADYTWNVKGFDMDKSWKDSFKYIEPDATEELHTIAKHMSNPQPNGHGLVLPESEELQPLLNEFKTKLQNNEPIKELGQRIITEMENIIKACNDFHVKSNNNALKEELLPYTNSLRDLCLSIKEFTKAQIAVEENNLFNAFNHYSSASAALTKSKTYTKPMISGGPKVVDPGSTHLIPLANTLNKKLTGPMNEYIGGNSEQPLTITASSSFTSWQEGNVNNIIDGNENTHAWHNGYERKGQYFQVSFSRPTTIYGVHILNGAAKDGKHTDTFGNAKIFYQVSGSDEWLPLTDTTYSNYQERVDVTGIEKENVVAVKYECVEAGSGNKWPSMREFKVATSPENENDFTKEVIRTSDGWSVYSGNEANLIDGDLNSSVWYNVRQSGTPANTTIKGDYVGVKLSKPITLGKINILQGVDDNSQDYFKNVKLQYSLDGNVWKDVPGESTFKNTKKIQVDLSDHDIKAQYVRLENQASQENWISFREFDVDAKLFFNAKAYTNVEAYKNHGANLHLESAELASKDGIKLAKGQYIGIKLDRVHEISNIVADFDAQSGLKLQISKNGQTWQDYTSNPAKTLEANKTVDARYVRIINTSDATVTFDLRNLSLNSVEIFEKSLVTDQTSFAIGEANSKPATNLFDGDRTTQVIFQGSQNQGSKFTYDLGQVIDLESLKVVCRDSEHDYPRHAKISVSVDGNTWQDVLFIGNQEGPNQGEATNEDNINDVLPLHETSYNAKEATNINKQARFIKFEITRTKVGADKWVRFQEFEINGGKYMPTVNDPTFNATCNDTQNGKFAYLVDNNLSTGFIPEADSGSLEYIVSDKNDKNVIKFVQNSENISNAVVYGQTSKNPNNWIELGKLAQTVNEFKLNPADDGDKLIAVKVVWDGVKPNLLELVLDKAEYSVVNKDELNTLLNEKLELDTWTTTSKATYNQAIEAGKLVKASNKVSQASVDSAVYAIELAKNEAESKGDLTKLQEALDKAHKDKENYTVKTWRQYSIVVAAIEKAIALGDDTSVADVTDLLADLEAANNGLVYSSDNFEKAIFVIEAENDFISSIENPEQKYTAASWSKYTEAKAALEALIAQGTTIHPNEFKTAQEALLKAKEGLTLIDGKPEVNLSELTLAYQKAQEISAEKLNSVVNAVKVEFLAARDEAKAILDKSNPTQKEVNDSFARLSFALQLLEFTKGDVTALQKLVNEYIKLDADDYTPESFANLQTAIKNANDVIADGENALEVDVEKAMEALQDAKNNLVAVVKVNKATLQAFYDKVKDTDLTKYLESSRGQFTTALTNASNVLKDQNATQKAVDEAYSTLVKAFLDLRLIPNKEALEELINKAESLNDSKLAKAIAQAKAVVADKNATEAQVKGAYATLEAAIKGLDAGDKVVANGDKAVATGDNNAMASMLSLAGLSLLGILANRRRKNK